MKAPGCSPRIGFLAASACACGSAYACVQPIADGPRPAATSPSLPAGQSTYADSAPQSYELDTKLSGAPASDEGSSTGGWTVRADAASQPSALLERPDGGTNEARNPTVAHSRDAALLEEARGRTTRVTGDASANDSGDDCAGGHVVRPGEDELDDSGVGNARAGCVDCGLSADHLLITEVSLAPAGAEFVEIFNPTTTPVDLSEYALSDNAHYAETAAGASDVAPTSDFTARFPPWSVLEAGAYATVAIGNADGPAASFRSTYGRLPDYELVPTANGGSDEPSVPNLLSVVPTPTIGASASLTDTGEPIVLFRMRSGLAVEDVDYVYVGKPNASNPAVDKTGLVAAGHAYAVDTPESAQRSMPCPPRGGSIQRCLLGEVGERQASPTTDPTEAHAAAVWHNGVTGHDETAEDWQRSFVQATAEQRTPGRAPPPALCR